MGVKTIKCTQNLYRNDDAQFDWGCIYKICKGFDAHIDPVRQLCIVRSQVRGSTGSLGSTRYVLPSSIDRISRVSRLTPRRIPPDRPCGSVQCHRNSWPPQILLETLDLCYSRRRLSFWFLLIFVCPNHFNLPIRIIIAWGCGLVFFLR